MKQHMEQASAWIYEGVWAVLVRWFRVPDRPPTLPGDQIESFRPAPGFLSLLKLQFWIVLALIDAAIFVVWIIITVAAPVIGLLLAIPALALAILPDVVAYIAIHLRYDTTWYVLSDRSLRVRRGIWIIHEMTITFENVQNIKVTQGPLQRWFGISTLVVQTAGGGGGGDPYGTGAVMHQGLIEGVADARRIRDLILPRIQQSRSTGLGDEAEAPSSPLGPRHVATLREIRDLARRLAERTA